MKQEDVWCVKFFLEISVTFSFYQNLTHYVVRLKNRRVCLLEDLQPLPFNITSPAQLPIEPLKQKSTTLQTHATSSFAVDSDSDHHYESLCNAQAQDESHFDTDSFDSDSDSDDASFARINMVSVRFGGCVVSEEEKTELPRPTNTLF